jgi:hypothetical protein
VLHALFISSSLTWAFQLYLAKSISYKTPQYAVFLQPPATTSLLRSKYYPSEPCSQPSYYTLWYSQGRQPYPGRRTCTYAC